MFNNLLRVTAALLIGAVVAIFSCPIAAAHISATLDGAGPGDFGLVTLRVPTESGTAATTKVEVRIPDDVQLRTVLAGPVAGWTIDVRKRTIPPIYKDDGTPVTEVVSSVTWTATGPGIPVGQFVQFALDVGPLPDAPTLALPTVQTFSDGTVKSWTQAATGDDKPEFPAPTVTIGATPSAASGAGTMVSVIAWTALGFAVIAVALGVFAIDRAAGVRRSIDAGSSDPATPARSSSTSESATAG